MEGVVAARGLRVLILKDDDFTRMTLAAVVATLGPDVVGHWYCPTLSCPSISVITALMTEG
jgi:hypothetical protein